MTLFFTPEALQFLPLKFPVIVPLSVRSLLPAVARYCLQSLMNHAVNSR
jgi:hypothetical protein